MPARILDQYSKDIAAAIRWFMASPDRIDRARVRHTPGPDGRCEAPMCREADAPCLIRWLADQALIRVIDRLPRKGAGL